MNSHVKYGIYFIKLKPIQGNDETFSWQFITKVKNEKRKEGRQRQIGTGLKNNFFCKLLSEIRHVFHLNENEKTCETELLFSESI